MDLFFRSMHWSIFQWTCLDWCTDLNQCPWWIFWLMGINSLIHIYQPIRVHWAYAYVDLCMTISTYADQRMLISVCRSAYDNQRLSISVHDNQRMMIYIHAWIHAYQCMGQCIDLCIDLYIDPCIDLCIVSYKYLCIDPYKYTWKDSYICLYLTS